MQLGGNDEILAEVARSGMFLPAIETIAEDFVSNYPIPPETAVAMATSSSKAATV